MLVRLFQTFDVLVSTYSLFSRSVVLSTQRARIGGTWKGSKIARALVLFVTFASMFRMSYLDVLARGGRKVMHLKLLSIRGKLFRTEYIFRVKFDYPLPRDIACQK